MKLTVSDRKTTPISEDLMGVFFEDINYGADGGLFAEQIENRSFEFVDCYGDKGDYYTVPDGGYGWSAYPDSESAALKIVCASPVSEENPHYLRLDIKKAGAGVSNKAYDGITLEEKAKYRVSFYARTVKFEGAVTVKIIKNDDVYARGSVTLQKENIMRYWHRYELVMTAEESVRGAKFVIEFSDSGTVELDFVSMLPVSAVEGIFRRDVVDKLRELGPAFMRFPGGCIIEGNTMANRYRFKDTLKRPEDRKSNWNRWAVHNNCEQNGFHSVFSHYNQTLGMGYYEFFLLCELINAKALPVMNVGMACQYQSYEYMEIGSPEFEQMVEDAIDLIEFANGSIDTKWGSVRKELGHEKPFNLEYLGIGNEQWQVENTNFFERYRIFEKRIHEKYPQIKLIGSAGPDVTSQHYTDAWEFYHKEKAKNPNFVYAVDEHYYKEPQWFLDHNDFYDNYPRDIKVFAGEYAAHDPEIKAVDVSKNNWKAAISEAAFLTGVERNADVVALSSYAPLFARAGYVQWAPDLIWMDDEKSWATPSFYVQELFSRYSAGYNLDLAGQAEEFRKQGVYCNACVLPEGKTIVKLVNTTDDDIEFSFEDEAGNSRQALTMTVMHAALTDYNSREKPLRVAPKEIGCSSSTVSLQGQTFAVICLK